MDPFIVQGKNVIFARPFTDDKDKQADSGEIEQEEQV